MKYTKRQLAKMKRLWPAKDWLASHTMMDLALESILSKVKLNRTFDIPYVAGYSNDGKIIYIDRDMPKSFTIRGRRIYTDRFLILHEAVEKTLITQLGLHYQFAHQIALRAEQAAVRADKISWLNYDQIMQKYIKEIGDKSLKRIPVNLDIKPYRDEHDRALLHRMKKISYQK